MKKAISILIMCFCILNLAACNSAEDIKPISQKDMIGYVDLRKEYGKIKLVSDVEKPKTKGGYNYFYYIVEEDAQNDIVIIVDYFQSELKFRNGF